MDYDRPTNTFSNLRVIVSRLGVDPSLPYAPVGNNSGIVPFGHDGCTTPALGNGVGAILPVGTCTGPCYPAWPFFTPDGKGVIFALTSEPDFVSAMPGRAIPAKSELWYVHVDTGEAVRLDNVNRGLAPEDPLGNYYPTVMPVAAGGKFWVFWTAKRTVGHRVFIAPPGTFTLTDVNPNDVHAKRIWLSAIDIDPAPGADPGHPGFYIAGQSDSGNVRAFTTLNPCKASDMECTTGLDCCGGFCNKEPGQEIGLCSEIVPPRCSQENERCESDADCCPPEDGSPTLRCLGTYCGRVILR